MNCIQLSLFFHWVVVEKGFQWDTFLVRILKGWRVNIYWPSINSWGCHCINFTSIGPNRYLYMVKGWTVRFQKIPFQTMDETNWLIRVLWLLSLSNQMILKNIIDLKVIYYLFQQCLHTFQKGQNILYYYNLLYSNCLSTLALKNKHIIRKIIYLKIEMFIK